MVVTGAAEELELNLEKYVELLAVLHAIKYVYAP